MVDLLASAAILRFACPDRKRHREQGVRMPESAR
jgi:hypothetical protein